MDSPEPPRSWATRPGVWLVVVLVVGVGMFLLGRRSHPAKNGAGGNAPVAGASVAPGSGERHLAPHDTFYLLQYVSAKKPDGVIGFEPGQEVHLVAVHQDSQTLVVGDSTAQVEVSPDKLTNDMDIAALVRRKDEDNQTKVAAYLDKEKQAYADSKREAAAKTEQALAKIDERKQQIQLQQQQAALAANDSKAQGSPVGSGDNPLDQPPVEVGGSSGYGYAGSAYYGSPYSYLGGSGGTVTTAPATTGAATSTGAARGVGGGVGTGGGAGRR